MRPEPRTLAEFAQQTLAGETTPRTIGVHDIVSFGTLTGDYSRVHFDEHFAAALPHGRRIALGLLSASLSVGGLSQDAPHVLGRRNPASHLSSLEVDYRRPVYPGDTLRTRWRSTPEASAGVSAQLRTDCEIVDQEERVVGDGWVRLSVPAAEDLRSIRSAVTSSFSRTSVRAATPGRPKATR